MKKQGKIVLVAVTEGQRQVLREVRERLGLTQAVADKKARLGKTYSWYVETGKTKSTSATALLRLATALQKEAQRGDVPARLKTGLQRLVQDLGKQGSGKG
jgi:transcriptional regulator with XRE-family HTH domain